MGNVMSAASSMQYTIGVAIDRARELGHVVELLVDGQWICGLVVISDGVGVVLDRDGCQHSVVRLERISAVRVCAEAPMRQRITSGGGAGTGRTPDGAVMMPAPRSATG
jgi:hypothetical protein